MAGFNVMTARFNVSVPAEVDVWDLEDHPMISQHCEQCGTPTAGTMRFCSVRCHHEYIDQATPRFTCGDCGNIGVLRERCSTCKRRGWVR